MAEIIDHKSAESGADHGARLFLFCMWALGIAVFLALAAMNLFWGEPNQDEGWYLYAARLVGQGKLPYVDFASTQGPVMPFVYSAIQPMIDRHGLAGGRLFTILFGFAGSLCAALLAARLAPAPRKESAAFLAFALAGVNVYQSYFCSIVKTYALCGLLIVLGFLALNSYRGKGGVFGSIVSGALFALAAGTRTSAGAILPVVFIWLFVAWIKRPAPQSASPATSPRPEWLWFGFGAALALCAVFGPFLLKAPTQLYFGLVEYHIARKPGGLMSLLAYKAGFVSRVVQAYFVASAVGVCAAVCAFGSKKGETARPAGSILPAIWLCVVAVSLVHFCASFPYDDYQAIVFPLAASAVAVAAAGLVADARTERRVVLAVFLLCVGAAFSSPINQQWFVAKQDRIWWPVRERSPLRKLQETGRRLRMLTKPGDVLLTQDPYLAVESGLTLPEGLELGPFSYFPDLPTEEARACHVLNRRLMVELLAKCEAPVAAFSGYGLAIESPRVAKLPDEERDALRGIVLERYKLFREVDDFGQAGTKLSIYLRK